MGKAMKKKFINGFLLLHFLFFVGCADVSYRNTTEYKYYSSGNRMCSVEMRGTFIGTRKQIWKPYGLTVFWYRNGNILKEENYVDGILCQYREFYPSGQKRVVAHLDSSVVRKNWKEFDESGTCTIDEPWVIGWNVKSNAGGSSDIKGKMVLFGDLYQDSENKLFFHRTNDLLYSGVAVSQKSEAGDIIESYDFLGGVKVGVFRSGKTVGADDKGKRVSAFDILF